MCVCVYMWEVKQEEEDSIAVWKSLLNEMFYIYIKMNEEVQETCEGKNLIFQHNAT